MAKFYRLINKIFYIETFCFTYNQFINKRKINFKLLTNIVIKLKINQPLRYFITTTLKNEAKSLHISPFTEKAKVFLVCGGLPLNKTIKLLLCIYKSCFITSGALALVRLEVKVSLLAGKEFNGHLIQSQKPTAAIWFFFCFAKTMFLQTKHPKPISSSLVLLIFIAFFFY